MSLCGSPGKKMGYGPRAHTQHTHLLRTQHGLNVCPPETLDIFFLARAPNLLDYRYHLILDTKILFTQVTGILAHSAYTHTTPRVYTICAQKHDPCKDRKPLIFLNVERADLLAA